MIRTRVVAIGIAMAVAVAAVVVVGCGGTAPAAPEQVPAEYLAVRASAGHLAHVGKVACAACHGPTGFAPPPKNLCAQCHAAKLTPLHPGANAPSCRDCHSFGPVPVLAAGAVADARSPCMHCHDRPQGAMHAVGAHSDQPCGNCHRAHQAPSLAPQPCTKCHAAQETKHAGARGCLDCHDVHEAKLAADQRCEHCHATEPAKLHVDAHAITVGHRACTRLCHQPHKFGALEVVPCATCHRNKLVLAQAVHAQCTSCHSPHADAPRACESCHHEVVAHPASTAGKCLGCHPIHSGVLAKNAKAVACETCHKTETHATAHCLDCHTPHGGKPASTAATCGRCHTDHVHAATAGGHADCALCHTAHGPKPTASVALCVRCHADRVRSTTSTGHADCATCHANATHAPATPPIACASCHRAEAASAPVGHQQCASCHAPHDPKHATPECATCHADKAKTAHGQALPCATCHRVHGPGGVAAAPACTSCHAIAKLPGLHRVAQHATACTTCHTAHEATAHVERATCLTCHRDRVNHEPTAPSCAGCHPFSRGTRAAMLGDMTTHAAVWISHGEAHVLDINPDKLDAVTVTAPKHIHHRHPKGDSGAKEHPDDAKRFFDEVAKSLVGFDQILVVGPSTAKLELIRYAHKHDHALEARIVGVETVDHPTDGQLAAHAKHYFKIAVGRMS